jgi:membrane associated rhomboid family serine protease
VQAQVGSQCVECVRAARPPAAERWRRYTATSGPIITYMLLAINVGVFIYMTARDSSSFGTGTRVTPTQFDLGLNRVLLSGEYYRLVTSGFIHFGLLHLAFNMYALYVLGTQMETGLGHLKFGLLYFSCLLTGSLGVVVLDKNAISGGASGAIFGLFGAFAVALWRRGINPFRTNVGTVLLLNLALTFLVPGISIGGHVGGLLGGAICGWAMFPDRVRRPPEWLTYVAPIVVGAVAVFLSVGLAG